MKINANMVEYVQKHWFKLLLLAIALYLFTQKEFSFSINLSDPSDAQESPLNHRNGRQATQKKQYFTENNATSKGILDHFDLSPFGNTSGKTKALDQLAAIPDAQKEAYLKRFAKVVIEERRKYGVPSSVLLAAALLHSLAGEQKVAKTANNHFTIRCSMDWQGSTVKENGVCFRAYENAWTSFRDNSLYLSSGKYTHLQSLGSSDYKGWAKQLEKMGYSHLDNFATQLIQVIETYGLDALDKQ